MLARLQSTTVLLCLALTVGAVTSRAASSEVDVEKLQDEWRTALTTGNVGALEAIFADQLVYVHSDGRIQNKQEFLAPIAAGTLRFESITSCDTPRMRAYDSSAVVSACYELKIGTSPPARHIFMMAFVKDVGQWRIVAIQTTMLPKK